MFSATVRNGRADLGADYNREAFRQWCAAHEGVRLIISPVLPESKKLRRWFEGAVVPLVTFYQEGLDHRSSTDVANVREWLKVEFNGELVTIAGTAHKVGGSTKGELNTGFVERVLDWLDENYEPPQEALDPESYKAWRDTIFPSGGPDNYIEHLVELGKLRKPYGSNQ